MTPNLTGSARPRTDGGRVSLESGLEHHQSGDLDQAERVYRSILSQKPTEPDALHLLGLILIQRGQPEDGARHIERAIKARPGAAPFHNNLGVAYRSSNNVIAAEREFRQAVRLDPTYVDARLNLARLLALSDQLAAAREEFDQLQDLCPTNIDILCDRAEVIAAQGRADEALAEFQRLAREAPTHPRVLMRLGLALESHGSVGQALHELQRASDLDPASSETAFHLGAAHQLAGNADQAITAYRRALAADPGHARAHGNLGTLLQERGDYEEAVEHYWSILDANPNDVTAYNNLGTLYQACHQHSEAATFYRLALKIDPEHSGAHANLGSILHGQGLLDEAEVHLRRSIEIAPTQVAAYSNLGGLLQAKGEFADAIDCYRRALEIDPSHDRARANLIFALDMDPSARPEDVYAERRAFNEHHALCLGAPSLEWSASRDPERRLRIGYVSADFRHHSAASTFMPVIESHDPAAVEVYCYSGVVQEDAVTEVCRAKSAIFRTTIGLTDEQLSDQIRANGIDILVDLSGYSSGNRLLTLARKPAPIIVTAWGHAVGTGLDAVDYFFGDSVAVPPSVAQYFHEHVIQLSSIVPFWKPEPCPEVAPGPAERRGYVTFGSLNRTHKITTEVIALWSKVLLAVPDSRFFMKYANLDKPANQVRYLAAFAAHGITSDRVSFAGASSRFEHLSAYGEIDVALDPFPHGGGVTALEGLWMGVPLVTLLGDGVPGRLSASFLTTLGYSSWIAQDQTAYVDQARALATDTAQLSDVRSELRSRMDASILCSGEHYCREVEARYRDIWRAWCKSP